MCGCYQLRPKAAEMPVGAKAGPQAGPGHMGDLGMLGGSHRETEGGRLHGDIFLLQITETNLPSLKLQGDFI